MALVASLESDLRMLAAEARRKFPAIKDAADRSIFKVRLVSNASQLASNDDVLKTFLLACESRNCKLSIMGLAGVDKLIAYNAVVPSVLPPILATLKELSDMTEEIVQLKTLQLSLTILQSQLYPKDEDQMVLILGLCLRLLGNSRNSDSVHSTAVATIRQAVALIFDSVLRADCLPVLHYGGTGGGRSSSNSSPGEGSRSISISSEVAEDDYVDNQLPFSTENKISSEEEILALHLFEDLTSFAGGGSATWLQVSQLQRNFALDMLEYVLSHYAVIFRRLSPFAQVLKRQVCPLLMTSLRTSSEIDSVVGEPAFRRLLLRSVASVTRLYNSVLTTECEVFISMLIKSLDLDLPPWHHIMVLEILRGLCVEARMLCQLFKTFDMKLKNTDMVSNIVHTLGRVVGRIELSDSSEEILKAVAGMFHSKAKGIEWTSEGDPSGMGALIESEAQAITLAVEGLLGVISTVATLTDETVGLEELLVLF